MTKKDEILSRLADAELVPPEVVTLSVTNRCNLNCRHCWPDSRTGNGVPMVPSEVLLRLVREFSDLGAEKFIFTGGESLLHPNLSDILSHTLGQQGVKEVCLQTNATLLTEAKVNDLLLTADGNLTIQVSLDGAAAENHDYVRSAGNFDLTLQGLGHLVKTGLGRKTYLAFTEMRHNFGDIPRALELVERLGLGRFVTGTLVRGGRAAQNSQLVQPAPEQYRELLSRYHFDKRFTELYDKYANIAAIEWFKGQSASNETDKVCTCIKNPLLTAGGILYPCAMFQYDEYAISDVHSRPLPDAISEALPLWAELPKISRLRSATLKACKGCPGQKHCAGGCMGRTQAHGNLMTVEDRCQLRKTVYGWEASESGTNLQ